MYKAYLAHSHADKAYVETVAKRLSRARVIYDVQNFSPGVDFRNAIRDGLDQSSLFVLFASSESLRSTWVKFEIDEAEVRRRLGKLQDVLVFIVDASTKVSDLPEWMRRGRVLSQTRPTQASRVILSQLIYQTGAEQQPLFVGREQLLQDMAKEMVPSSGQRPPQLLIASGLQGVGRRTLMRRALRDNLSLDFGPVFYLEDTDGLDRLYVLLLDETTVLPDRATMASAIAKFAAANAKERADLIAEQLSIIAADNAATVLVDDGCLLDPSGQYVPGAAAVFERLGTHTSEPYLILIQRRKPHVELTNFGECRVASFVVPPIAPEPMKRLFGQSFKLSGLPAPKEEQIDEIVPYLSGYPPSVNLAIGYSKTYGLETLLVDKSVLVDFRVRTFSRIVERLELSPEERQIARVLGIEPSLSLDVISTLTDMAPDQIAPRIRRLIDFNLVVQEAGKYSLAAPIRDTVYRAFGLLNREEFSQMGSKMKEKYWQKIDVAPPLEVIDATVYTLARSNDRELASFADLIIPSALLKIATEAYNAREWITARDLAERAVLADPTLERAHTIYSKALVRLAHEGTGEWSAAEKSIRIMEKAGIRGHQYLRGFLEWKRGNLEEAIKAYIAAEKAGDKGVPIYRDRAHCFFKLGQIAEADRDIQIAMKRYARNKYIVDLAAEIAIVRGRYSEAEELIGDLESIDVLENFLHRRASLKAARKQFLSALEDTENACLREPPLHHILAQRVDILIELSRFPEATDKLVELESRFRGRNAHDVHLGLRCKLELRQGNWQQAEKYHDQLDSKTSAVHLGLRAEILRQKITDSKLKEHERNALEQEAKTIESKLAWNPPGTA
jgi:tetratricopeptide (TPR) repeat protein